MAVGDIVTIGALQGTDKYGNSKKLQQVPSQSAPNFQDYALYTFVDNTDSKYGFKWIESKIDGKTVYISQTFVLKDVSYNEVIERANINKTLNINGSLYNLRLLSKDEFQNKLSSTVLDQLDFSITSSNPLYTLTSTILNGTNVINIIYNKDNYIPYIKSLWDENDFSLHTSSTANGCILALELLNNPPTISGEDENLGNKTSSFSITYYISDEDNDQELTVKEKLNGSIIRTLKNPTQNSTLTFTITDELFVSLSMNTTNTIEIEVTDGSATTYRRYTFVKTNSAPFITYTGQADLGELTTKPSITYSVKDNEGDAITVTEKLNGEVINQFSATTNTNYTVGIIDTFWLTCGSNTNTVEIIASDALGGSSSKTITFSRKITKLQIVMKNAIETDAKATKILVSPQWTTTGGVGKVEVCNNGFDPNPTWEDATTMVVLNRPHLFTNTSKTASKWGIKIRITVTKNQGYDGEVAIFGFGGAYE